jgi:hypothetical protein
VEKVSEDAGAVTIRLDRTESRIANNSLNEVANLIRIPDSEFVSRLSGSRAETRDLLRRVQAANGATIRLGRSDLTLLRNAMIEVTKGGEIPAWEYPIRLGASLEEGKRLLGEVEELLAARLDRDLCRAHEIFLGEASEATDAELEEILPDLISAGLVSEYGHSATGSLWQFTQAGVERAEELGCL